MKHSLSQWKSYFERRWEKNARRLVHELNTITRELKRSPPLTDEAVSAMIIDLEDLRDALHTMELHINEIVDRKLKVM